MSPAPVTRLPSGRDRDRRVARLSEARGRTRVAFERIASDRRGRAWINGREVGGSDARYAHLSRSHD